VFVLGEKRRSVEERETVILSPFHFPVERLGRLSGFHDAPHDSGVHETTQLRD
jgi:hypothetical protein